MLEQYGFLFSVRAKRRTCPESTFGSCGSNVSMTDVLGLLGFVALSRRGEQVRGECPLHRSSKPGKHRSFSANLGRHTFQCFKCGVSGNQLDLDEGNLVAGSLCRPRPLRTPEQAATVALGVTAFPARNGVR
jgi:hypothetical protein